MTTSMHHDHIFGDDNLACYEEGRREAASEKERERKDKGRRSTRYIHNISLYCASLVIVYNIIAIVLDVML